MWIFEDFVLFPVLSAFFFFLGVDTSFEKLLGRIFGEDFLGHFKMRRPASYVDLLIAFEARKRSASPFKCTPLNISLPFSFIDAFRKYRGKEVEAAIQKHNDPHIRWSSQGMLRYVEDSSFQFFSSLLNITPPLLRCTTILRHFITSIQMVTTKFHFC